jgi:cyclic lactone autoinducer peptide
MKANILKVLSYALAAVGLLASGASNVGCMIIFIDEPQMPTSMIEQ